MFGLFRKASEPKPASAWFRARPASADNERRFEAAGTDRLTAAHWQRAGGSRDINASLNTHLRALRDRCVYETANNPFVDSVVRTYTRDVVGPCGPKLQVRSSDDAYNAALEKAWAKWWRKPDINGKLSGPSLLRLAIRCHAVFGEHLIQETKAAKPKPGAAAYRVRCLNPRLLDTPGFWKRSYNEAHELVMGVEVTLTGEPVAYWIEQTQGFGFFGAGIGGGTYQRFPAEYILHGFEMVEPDQIRGIPMLTPCLNTMADLRDYDAEVLEAARAQATFAAYLYSDHPEITPFNMAANGAPIEIERGQMTALPPGYRVESLQGSQPTTNYVDYRHERMRELGCPFGMPLMIVMSDASNHNYSSARFDGQGYQEHLRTARYAIETDMLDRLVDNLARELRIMEVLTRREAPDDVVYEWTWAGRPHVDPSKEAKAEELELVNCTLTIKEALARKGKDYESVLEQLKAEIAEFKAAGLVHPATREALAGMGGESADEDAEDDEAAAKRERRETALASAQSALIGSEV